MRQLERKLEAVLERAGGQFFRGKLHVSELAGSIVRVLDLSVDSAGLAPNRIMVPASGTFAADSLSDLESAITEAVYERGWRIEGPVTVVASDVRTVTVTVEPGALPAWGKLRGPGDPTVHVNRAVIGRSAGCDVVIDDQSVSRRHARLWRQDGRVLCVDLGSSNGTRVAGRPVGSSPVQVDHGAEIEFGGATYRFERASGA